MNDYLDQLDLEKQEISKNIKNYVDDQDYLQDLKTSIFYFLVARIFRNRNLMEEFNRFLNLGFDELFLILENLTESQVKQEYKVIIIFLQRVQNVLENQKLDKQILLNFNINFFKMFQQKWNLNSHQQFLLIRVMLAEYFQSQDDFEKCYELLLPAYENKEKIDIDDQLFLLYSNIYYCQQKGYFQDLDADSIIKLADEPLNVNRNYYLIQLLEYHMCNFDDELDKKNFDSLKVRFYKILDLINYSFILIEQTKIEANLPIFSWIDLIIQNKIAKNNIWIIEEIYEVLKQFTAVKLFSETQEFYKNFYLAILPYKIKDKQPIQSKQRLKNLENFVNQLISMIIFQVNKYLQNQNMQNILVNKLILFNFSLIEDQQFDECLKVIECINSIISKQKNDKELNQFSKQLQNQKNQISKLKNKK